MGRGDSGKDSADRLMPPQAAGMSCYSMAEEITPVCADYLVVDAVQKNWSPAAEEQGIYPKMAVRLRFGLQIQLSKQRVAAEFPRKHNRELIRENRELRSNNRDHWPTLRSPFA
jgi:hypothetical protein